MTRDDLHIAFKIEMDKNSQSTAFGGCPAFLTEEIDYWLNQSIQQLVSTKFTGNNALKTPFEGNVKRVQDLEKLVKTDKNISVELEENTNRIILPNLLNKNVNSQGRMFFVSAALHWTDTNNIKIPRKTASIVTMVDHTVANKFLETYNNKPWIDNPVATIEDNSLIIYVDTVYTQAPYSVDITYVKYPTPVEKTSANEGIVEIPEYMKYEIVNTAVALALENIESRRVQTKTQLNTMQE